MFFSKLFFRNSFSNIFSKMLFFKIFVPNFLFPKFFCNFFFHEDPVLYLQLVYRTIIFNVIVCQLIKHSQYRTRHCTHTNAALSTEIGRKVSYASREERLITFLPCSIIFYFVKITVANSQLCVTEELIEKLNFVKLSKKIHQPQNYLFTICQY